ncbi:8702_t:CDS:2 [Gigaspora margarita]|uniref:8702_t:CDS:1 n=1 Tax=Gigaspora margarita TaxID=4874 RepID=A0ABN7UXT2_GIGMA|nr:8702_t:CDS:2 [Gigaspora margarita]
MRLDVEIKKLFQKKEQEIVGIFEKFKNRVLKKDQAVTKYLGIQHQTTMEKIELLELNKNTNQPNKVVNQAQIAKDTLLQLEYSTHDYGTKELQATINEDEKLQEEIVRINRTTHLLERESLTDIEMSEKEEINSIIADVTNEVEVLQDSLQSISIQEENKKSHPTKIDYLTHDKAREDISVSIWAPHNRVNFTSTNQTQVTQEITSMTNQSCSRQKPAITITIWDLPEDTRNFRPKQATATQEKEPIESSKNENTKTPCDMNSTGSLPEKKLLKEILERLSNLKGKQQTSKNFSTSSFQTSRQLLKSCDNSAAPSMRKNSNNNIAPSTALREEMNLSIREINKKLNVEIASVEEHWSKYIQEGIYYLVNEVITEEEWEQVVSTLSNKLALELILQDDKILATWSQLKLIKGATRKGRKPIWFEYLESIVLQDSTTRKIKDDLYTSTDLRGLAIPNLQCLAANRIIKDWVITKEIDSKPILEHIIKKNSNSVLIEHWKELNHLVLSQSKLEKFKKYFLSTDPTQDSCTLRISKEKIVGVHPKAALELASKMTKIKMNL